MLVRSAKHVAVSQFISDVQGADGDGDHLKSRRGIMAHGQVVWKTSLWGDTKESGELGRTEPSIFQASVKPTKRFHWFSKSKQPLTKALVYEALFGVLFCYYDSCLRLRLHKEFYSVSCCVCHRNVNWMWFFVSRCTWSKQLEFCIVWA